MAYRDNITPGTSRILKNGLKIMVPGSKSSCRERVGIKGAYGILEQVGSLQQAQKCYMMMMILLSIASKNTGFGTFGPVETEQNRH